MKCPKCSTLNDDEYIFCVNCGASIIANTKTEAYSPETRKFPPAQQNTFNKPADTEFVPPEKFVIPNFSSFPSNPTLIHDSSSNKGRKVLLIGLAAAVFLLISGGIGIAIWRSIPPAPVEILPDHLGMFLLNKEKTHLSELRRDEFGNAFEAAERLLKDESLPGGDEMPDVILYAEGADVPLNDLKVVPLDSIKTDGTMKQIDFQASLVDGKPAMKRLRFPSGLAAGRYAFALFDGYLDEGKHRFWAFQIKNSVKSDNGSMARDAVLALKTKQPETNTSLTNTQPEAKKAIDPPIGSTVAYCNSTKVRLRPKPGTEEGNFPLLKKDQKVFIIGYSDREDIWEGVYYKWAQVQTESGKRGWVLRVFLSY